MAKLRMSLAILSALSFLACGGMAEGEQATNPTASGSIEPVLEITIGPGGFSKSSVECIEPCRVKFNCEIQPVCEIEYSEKGQKRTTAFGTGESRPRLFSGPAEYTFVSKDNGKSLRFSAKYKAEGDKRVFGPGKPPEP